MVNTSNAGNQRPFNLLGNLDQMLQLAKIHDASGSAVVPLPSGQIDIGGGARLEFDENSLRGKITPALSGRTLNAMDLMYGDAPVSFTGSDLRIMLEMASINPLGDYKPTVGRQFLECTALSVSTHRETTPVRVPGFINPIDFVLGGRTIAGSIICTQFTTDILFRFLSSFTMVDGSKDSTYFKDDQLPPLNLTLLFSNEEGYASYQRLLNVKIVDDGVVYSQNDMYTERQLSYMAMDFTPSSISQQSHFRTRVSLFRPKENPSRAGDCSDKRVTEAENAGANNAQADVVHAGQRPTIHAGGGRERPLRLKNNGSRSPRCCARLP